MSLDNIQIPAIVVQELYRNSLVDLQTTLVTEVSATCPQLAFLGNNQKHIIIAVKEQNALYLPEEELEFLLGILTACKLSMADIALVNLSKNTGINYKTITEQMGAEKLILFGAEPSSLELPIQFPQFQLQKFNNQVYLSAPPLKELARDRVVKSRLWNCLKQFFQLTD